TVGTSTRRPTPTPSPGAARRPHPGTSCPPTASGTATGPPPTSCWPTSPTWPLTIPPWNSTWLRSSPASTAHPAKRARNDQQEDRSGTPGEQMVNEAELGQTLD